MSFREASAGVDMSLKNPSHLADAFMTCFRQLFALQCMSFHTVLCIDATCDSSMHTQLVLVPFGLVLGSLTSFHWLHINLLVTSCLGGHSLYLWESGKERSFSLLRARTRPQCSSSSFQALKTKEPVEERPYNSLEIGREDV